MVEYERYLIVGDGAREDSIGWKISHDRPNAYLYSGPGNAGTNSWGLLLPEYFFENMNQAADRSKEMGFNLVIPGSENYFADGIWNVLHDRGINVFGPTKAASIIEKSKAWSANFMRRHSIPQGDFRVFTDPNQAVQFLNQELWEPVLKLDGLHNGKGVAVPNDTYEAKHEVVDMMRKNPGEKMVIQERLYGEELSVMAFSDGHNTVMMPPGRDNKRINDGVNGEGSGPNTGGMGAIVSKDLVSRDLIDQIEEEIVKPMILKIEAEGRPFVGVLYPGLMLTKNGPKVLEGGCRFGDPEVDQH